MPIVQHPVFSLAARGSLGRLISFRRLRGKTIATPYHKPTGEPTQAQLAQRLFMQVMFMSATIPPSSIVGNIEAEAAKPVAIPLADLLAYIGLEKAVNAEAQTWQNDDTPSDVTDLKINVKAGCRYAFMACLRTTSNSTRGWKFHATGPAGALMHCIAEEAGSASARVVITSTNCIVNFGTGEHIVKLTGTVQGQTADGVIQLQASQSSSGPETITIRSGSWIIALKL